MTLGKPYEYVAEAGDPSEAQQNVAHGLAQGKDRTEIVLLADGRVRVYLLDRAEIIKRILYIAPDGQIEEES